MNSIKLGTSLITDNGLIALYKYKHLNWVYFSCFEELNNNRRISWIGVNYLAQIMNKSFATISYCNKNDVE